MNNLDRIDAIDQALDQARAIIYLLHDRDRSEEHFEHAHIEAAYGLAVSLIEAAGRLANELHRNP